MDDLTELAPPPVTVQECQSWAEVERELGVALPADYRAFAERYGSGEFGGFVWTLSPCTSNRNLDLVGTVKAQGRSYATLHDHHPANFPLPPFPAPGSFMPWAVTDNGDYLGWILSEGAPDEWKVAVLDDEEGSPQVFDLSFGPFIAGLVAGHVQPDAFPADMFESLPMPFVPDTE